MDCVMSRVFGLMLLFVPLAEAAMIRIAAVPMILYSPILCYRAWRTRF